jgi:hypothetical protein
LKSSLFFEIDVRIDVSKSLVLTTRHARQKNGVPTFVPLRWYNRTNAVKQKYQRSETKVPPQWK